MNVRDLKDVLDKEVQRPDMNYKYMIWINRALKKIQQDYSWGCMRTSGNVVIQAGTSSVRLPADFKEFTPEYTPIHLIVGDTPGKMRYYPVELSTFERVARADSYLLFPYTPQQMISEKFAVPLWMTLEGDNQEAFLNILALPQQELTYRVSYYRFLPRLETDAQDNFITREYEEMVEAKLKATAFASLNDPLAADFEGLYVGMAKLARGADELRRFQGRTLRMGGG